MSRCVAIKAFFLGSIWIDTNSRIDVRFGETKKVINKPQSKCMRVKCGDRNLD